MIRYRVKELIADKEFREGRRITIDEIARSSGIHRATLSKILNQPGYNTSTDVLEKLCIFFGVGLGAVAEYVPEQSNAAN